MLNRFKLLNTSLLRTNLVVQAVSTQIPSSLAIRFSYVYTPLYGCVQRSYFSSAVPRNSRRSVSWKDVYNMIDEPENREKPLRQRIKGIKDQAIKLGGIRVIVFHTVGFGFFWALLYVILRYSALDIDTLINFMNNYSFMSKYTGLVLRYPDASYLILSYIAVNIVDPLRYVLTFGYMSHILKKRYLQIAMDNIATENDNQKKVSASLPKSDIDVEESLNPKLKSSRIISIKGENNSSLNL